MLYSKNGKVYMTARSKEKAEKAIEDIKNAVPKSTGTLVPLVLDLTDLSTIKASTEQFTAAESRLHVLFNNAGYMGPEKVVERTPQGHEMHMGVNCLGPFLFTKLLMPILVATAQDKATPPDTVRVVFLSSFAADLFSDKDTIVDMDNLDMHVEKDFRMPSTGTAPARPATGSTGLSCPSGSRPRASSGWASTPGISRRSWPATRVLSFRPWRALYATQWPTVHTLSCGPACPPR